MSWTDEQRETIEGIPTGLHMNKGQPCECGPDPIRTRKEVGYSDFVTYTHTCTDCGNEFETYTEG